jgi:hypothetical protein
MVIDIHGEKSVNDTENPVFNSTIIASSINGCIHSEQ